MSAEADHAALAVRLRDDFPWYAEHCLKITNTRAQSIPFVLKPAQLRIDAMLEEQRAAGRPMRLIVPKARKEGVSTYATGRVIQRATQRANHNAIQVALDSDTSGELLAMAEMMYGNLPATKAFAIKPPIANRLRRKEIVWGNPSKTSRETGDVGLNSRLIVQPAGEFEAGRGYTFHSVHGSECAFFPDLKRKLTALLNAVPDEAETLIILESTSNGHNHWRTLCMQAQDGENDFAICFLPWFAEPQYTRAFLGDEERAEFGETVGTGPYGAQEPDLIDIHGVTLEQLQWRRWAIANRCQGDLRVFAQEYPACVTAETRVSTEQGIIPICEVVTGDHQFTESGPIVAAGPMTETPVFKLTTKSGRILRGTDDHPVHTPSGLFKGIAELQPGDKITLRPPRFAEREYVESWSGLAGVESSIRITQDYARFLGYYMGDGSWYKGTVSIVCDGRDTDVHEDVSRLMKQFLGGITHRDHVHKQGSRGAREFRVGAMPALDAFKRLGLISNGEDRDMALCAYKRRVRVPECIWRSPEHVVGEFLSGLFEADGSVSLTGNVILGTKHEDFARDVQLLLLGFGIQSKVSLNAKKYENRVFNNYVVRLGVRDSYRFGDVIGFRSARKTAKLGDGKFDGRAPAVEMVDEVLSVVPDGHEMTYDLTIEGEHVFSANGILTHNTLDESFGATGRQVFNSDHVSRARTLVESLPEGEQGTLHAGSTKPFQARFGRIEIPQAPKWTPTPAGPWLIFQQPEKDMQYIVSGDPAGDEIGDDTAAMHAGQVIEHATGVQVAELEFQGDTDTFAEQLFLAALLYNKAWVVIENTGGYGSSAIRRIHKDWRHPYMYRRRPTDARQDNAESDRLGWDTNRGTRPMLIDGGIELLREETHGIHSRRLMRQFSTFIKDTRGKPVPAPGERSDLLMSWLIAQHVRLVLPARRQKGSGTITTGRAVMDPVTGW